MQAIIELNQNTMITTQKVLEQHSRNISQMQTPGYKRTYLEQINRTATHQSELAIQQHTQFEQGTLNETHQPLNIGLHGKGFFKVLKNNDVYLTRNGSLTIDEHGILKTQQGATVLGQHGVITVDNASCHITNNGDILVNNEQIDALQLVESDDIQSLKYLGAGLYTTSEENIHKAQNTTVQQGFLETSNAHPVSDLMPMYQTIRLMNQSSKLTHCVNQLLKACINQTGDNRG